MCLRSAGRRSATTPPAFGDASGNADPDRHRHSNRHTHEDRDPDRHADTTPPHTYPNTPAVTDPAARLATHSRRLP